MLMDEETKRNLIVYSRDGCENSRKAIELLKSLNLPVFEISLDAFPKVSLLVQLMVCSVQSEKKKKTSVRRNYQHMCTS